MTKRIHIVGCARTGTTLLQRCMSAFAGAHVHWGETNVHDALAMGRACKQGGVCVTKRTTRTVFGWDLPGREVWRQLQDFKRAGVVLVCCTRDKGAVLASGGGYVSPERYDAAMHHLSEFGGHIRAEVRYEDLVAHPNAVQLALAHALDLECPMFDRLDGDDDAFGWRFSQYPDFVPEAGLAGLDCEAKHGD